MPRHPPPGGPRLLPQLRPDGQDPAEPEPRAGAGDAARDVGTLQVDGSLAQIPRGRLPTQTVHQNALHQIWFRQLQKLNFL